MVNATPITEKHQSATPCIRQQADAELFASDPLLSAVGIGKELWADEHADEYVAQLRKD